MASLTDILSQALAVKDEIAAGRFVGAWEKTLPLQQGAIELLRATGLESAADDAATKAKIRATLEECQRLCENPPANTEAGRVGAIGDGTILKLILQLVMTILPILL